MVLSAGYPTKLYNLILLFDVTILLFDFYIKYYFEFYNLYLHYFIHIANSYILIFII